MNWKDIGKIVGKYAPILGTALGGPAAGGIISLVSSVFGVNDEEARKDPSILVKAIERDPQAAMKLREIEANTKVELQKLIVQAKAQELAAHTQRILAVNETMRVEAQSEKWWQSAWRPFWGFCGGVTFFGSYFILPLLGYDVPRIPYEAWGVMAAILGVASWGRNRLKEKMVDR